MNARDPLSLIVADENVSPAFRRALAAGAAPWLCEVLSRPRLPVDPDERRAELREEEDDGDAWKEKAFAYDEFGAQQRERCKDIGIRIGKSIFTGKKGHARNPDMGPRVVKRGKQLDIPPCAICNT